MVGWSVDSLIGSFVCMWCYSVYLEEDQYGVLLSLQYLLSDCTKKLFTWQEALPLHFVENLISSHHATLDASHLTISNQWKCQITGKGKQIKVFQKVRTSNLRLQNQSNISPCSNKITTILVWSYDSSQQLRLRASKPYFPYFRASSLRRFNTSSLGGSIKRRCRAFSDISSAASGMSRVWWIRNKFTKMYINFRVALPQILKESKKTSISGASSEKKTCPDMDPSEPRHIHSGSVSECRHKACYS